MKTTLKLTGRDEFLDTNDLIESKPIPKLTEWGHEQAANYLKRLDIKRLLKDYCNERKGERMPIDHLLLGVFQMMNETSYENNYMGTFTLTIDNSGLDMIHALQVSMDEVALIDYWSKEYCVVSNWNQ